VVLEEGADRRRLDARCCDLEAFNKAIDRSLEAIVSLAKNTSKIFLPLSNDDDTPQQNFDGILSGPQNGTAEVVGLASSTPRTRDIPGVTASFMGTLAACSALVAACPLGAPSHRAIRLRSTLPWPTERARPAPRGRDWVRSRPCLAASPPRVFSHSPGGSHHRPRAAALSPRSFPHSPGWANHSWTALYCSPTWVN